MPLSTTNKAQSQSIEDLIAQLDTPTAGGQNEESNDSQKNQTNGVNGQNSANGTSRKLLKGKRSSNGSPNTTNTASSFVKTNSFGQNSEPVLSKNIIMSKKYSKHMRTLNNRGQPKKNGGGGKFTWGASGCELNEDFLDSKDPNYDSEEAGNVVMVCVENSDGGSGQKGAHRMKNRSIADNEDDDDDQALKELDFDDLETEIKPVLLEYFHNGDTIEVIDHLKCYNFQKIKPILISYVIQIALEHNNTCKELTSRLLRDLTFELFVEKDFVNGFDLLLKNLTDITLDNPDAPEVVYFFCYFFFVIWKC
jgi:hypothetical protein